MGGRIAGIGWTRLGNRLSVRAVALAVAGEDAGHTIRGTGAGLAMGTLREKATGALAIAGSVLPTGRGRSGGADQRIVGGHPRRNHGTGAQGAGQIAGHAGLPTGRGATDPVRAESSAALPIAATGFSHSLGLAGRFRRAGVGRGNVGGRAILPPAIAKVGFAELGRRATNRTQGNAHQNGSLFPHVSSPASCRWSARAVAVLFAPHRACNAARTGRGEAADLPAGALHAGVLWQAVACGSTRCLAVPG